MQRFLSLLILPVMSFPAWAADPPVADAPAHHARVTWEQHFTQANIAHDGHLTLQEAKDGYPLVAKHFDDIDVDHKEYVTKNDIRAWQIMRKAAHRLARPPEDKLRPRNAFQGGRPDLRSVSAAGSETAVPSISAPSDQR
jgi:hypothetical protein